MPAKPYPYATLTLDKVTLEASDGHTRRHPKDFRQTHPSEAISDVTYTVCADPLTRKKWLTEIGTLLIRLSPTHVTCKFCSTDLPGTCSSSHPSRYPPVHAFRLSWILQALHQIHPARWPCSLQANFSDGYVSLLSHVYLYLILRRCNDLALQQI